MQFVYKQHKIFDNYENARTKISNTENYESNQFIIFEIFKNQLLSQ